MGYGCLVVRSQFRSRSVPGSKPNSTDDPPCMCGIGALQIQRRGSKSSPLAGVMQKFGKGVIAQPSSSDYDSKLQAPSQNSPRAAS
ncbi:hypothetical protein AVEN_74602-1 [Araneus ventricosus]|uniref:Uncharacterized protein n=1 Tax=Araneus ventricosus TaxID=182803 RepID=A0A4Y2QND4_ARAVE|nr:hypothetical protein AVEN_192865-1 [Araneus ventricosus]GBN64849.1 hypothetical protein AVEN_74602-1 [Araneus ventricosus]